MINNSIVAVVCLINCLVATVGCLYFRILQIRLVDGIENSLGGRYATVKVRVSERVATNEQQRIVR